MNFVESYNQEIKIENKSITLFIKREDLIHRYISGNKFRKLKYNLVQAKKENKETILTFVAHFLIIFWQLLQQGKKKDLELLES